MADSDTTGERSSGLASMQQLLCGFTEFSNSELLAFCDGCHYDIRGSRNSRKDILTGIYGTLIATEYKDYHIKYLRDICRETGVATEGTRNDIIYRLVMGEVARDMRGHGRRNKQKAVQQEVEKKVQLRPAAAPSSARKRSDSTRTSAVPVPPATSACTTVSGQLSAAASSQSSSVSAAADPALPGNEPCRQPTLTDGHAQQSSNSTSAGSSCAKPVAEDYDVLTKAGHVTVKSLFGFPSVQFVQQPGLIICSAYANTLDNLRGSSLGAVKDQMAEAGVDLAPAIKSLACDNDGSSTSEKALIKVLWTRPRSRYSVAPRKVKCDAIAVALLPGSWESELAEEEADDPTAALRSLYADIQQHLIDLQPKALVMVAVGKTTRFGTEVVAQELLSLAMFVSNEVSKLGSLREINLATFNRSTVEVLKEVFNQQGIRGSGQVEKLPELVSQLRQLLPQLRSLSELRAQVEVLVTAAEHAISGSPEFQPQLQVLLQDMEIAASKQAAAKLDRADVLLPGLKAFLSHLQQHLSTTTTTKMRHEYTASVCCMHIRLVLEAVLKFLAHGGAQPSHLQQEVEQRLQKLIQQQQQSKSRGSKDCSNVKLMAGDYMYLLAKAAKKDKNVAAVYTQEVQKCCNSLRNTGNKAVHLPGKVTVVDANIGLSVVQQLLSLLIVVGVAAPTPA